MKAGRAHRQTVCIDASGAQATRLGRRADGNPSNQETRTSRALGSSVRYLLALVMLWCGLWGLARLVCTMADLPCDPLAAAAWGMLPCLIACFDAVWWPDRAGRTVLACFACWVGMLALLHQRVRVQAGALMDAVASGAGAAQAGDLAVVAGLAGALAGCVLCALALLAHRGWTLSLVTFPLVLICPQIGCDPGWQTCALLLVYHALALAFDQGGRRFGRTRPGVAALALAVAALALAVAVPAALRWQEELSALPRALDLRAAELTASVRDWAAERSESDASDDEAGEAVDSSGGDIYEQDSAASAAEVAELLGNAGTVNRGDLTAVDGTVAELTADRQPQATLYLAYFRGGTYSGSVWQPADDQTAGYEDAALALAAFEQALSDGDAWGASPLALTVTADPAVLDPRDLLPYAAVPTSYDASGEAGGAASTAAASFAAFDLGTYDDIVALGVSLDTDGDDAYAAWALQTYTQVPVDEVARLAQLVADNPMPDLASAVAFVQETLADSARYTTEPGTFPDGVDVAEYLLFEGHAGYCQHFATAATLMLRLYGYPARYVTGLAVPASAFEQQADGTWAAVADGENAHAWTEVYTDELGWVPVEVTPAGSEAAPWGETSTQDDGGADGQGDTDGAADVEDEEEEEEETADAGAEERGGVDAEDAENDGSEETDVEEEGEEENAEEGEGDAGRQPSPAAVALAAAAAAVIVAGAAALRRRRTLRRRAQAPANEVLAEMVEVLHYGGLLQGYGGTEAGFPAALAQAVPAIGPDRAERLVEDCLRAAFGPGEDAVPCDPYIQDAYRAACEQVRAGLSPLRRVAFRYLRAFD